MDAANALLSFGAELDSLNIFDETPLDVAMANNREEMVDLLRSLDGQTGSYVRKRVNDFVKLDQAPLLASMMKEMKEEDGHAHLRQKAYDSLEERLDSLERADESFSAWLEWKKKYQSLRENRGLLRYKRSNDTPPVFHLKEGHRVLCLDGGGIRGLIQVEVLIHLEESTGRRIPELFDWIVGTSTGGIVALALVYGEFSTCSTYIHVQYIHTCTA